MRICALVALLTAGSFVLDGPVHRFTHQHFNYFMRPVPSSHKLATRILRSMEDWGENVFIVAVAIAMWRLDRRRRSRILCIGLAALVVALVVEGAKRVTGRERPNISQGQLAFRGPEVWLTGEYGPPPDPSWKPSAGDYQSFPSGHTASAGVYSGALATFYPPLRPVCIALAVGCGANRIWKERHYLSDCWIGGAFGYWIASILPRRRAIQPLLRWFDRRFSVADESPALDCAAGLALPCSVPAPSLQRNAEPAAQARANHPRPHADVLGPQRKQGQIAARPRAQS